MTNFRQYIEVTKKLICGNGSWQDLVIPPDYAGEVARGTAILDAYTNFSLKDYDLDDYTHVVSNPDDGYCILDAYVYGAIQLAEYFGSDDFYNYYSIWVDEVIIPAIMEVNKEFFDIIKKL